jgi:ribosomal protein L11 methyltransferase
MRDFSLRKSIGVLRWSPEALWRNNQDMARARRWTEVRVGLPREAQEAVANFLMEGGSSGLVIEEGKRKEGFEVIKAYFPPPLVIQAGSISRYLEAIREFFPKIRPSAVRVRSIAERDWMKRWRTLFKPSQPGRGIVVKPPWINLAPGDVVVIDIEPGMAFGTGTHPTTRLCLRALERAFAGKYGHRPRDEHRPYSFLDVGMGSGILMIAAAKLGARNVLGIDVDQRAVENARKNVRINGLGGRVRMRKAPISEIGGRFDLVVANIDAKSIEEMRSPLMDRVAAGGILVLSGFSEREAGPLSKDFRDGSFSLAEVSQENGWACVVLRRA